MIVAPHQSPNLVQAPCWAAISTVPITDEVLKVKLDPLRAIRIARERVQSFRLVALAQDGVTNLGRQAVNMLRVVAALPRASTVFGSIGRQLMKD